MDSGVFNFLVMLLSALLLYVLAYLIGVKKRVGPIVGSDPSRVADPGWVGQPGGTDPLPHRRRHSFNGWGCLFIEKTLTLILAGVALITALVIALIVGIQKYVA